MFPQTASLSYNHITISNTYLCLGTSFHRVVCGIYGNTRQPLMNIYGGGEYLPTHLATVFTEPDSVFVQEVVSSLWNLINPRRACAARVTVLGLSFCLSVCLSVRPSVRYHLFWHYAQQGGQKAIPTGSVPHWLDF